jgi:type VI secretion system secreted protein VgrG
VPTPRYFHGSARRFTTLGPDERENWHYTIGVVPQIWFMNQTENCRFFENRSVKDIVSTLLGDIGVLFSFRLHEAPGGARIHRAVQRN